MAIVKCKYGHFYDNIKHKECPVCNNNNYADNDDPTMASGLFDFKGNNDLKTEVLDQNIADEQNTIPLYVLDNENNPVVGWLISVSGETKGKSYEIHNGRNFVGRSMAMDIVFSSDKSISRDKHFSIIFDEKTNEFFVVSGISSVFVNGTRVSVPCKICENDYISAGESNFIFVPFCKEGRNWNEK